MPIERQESAYRAAHAATATLLFGGTFACAPCRLRFARRTTCPRCGTTDVLSLDRDGRATYRARTGTGRAPASPGVLAMLPRWLSGVLDLVRSFFAVGSPRALPAPPARMRVHTAGPSEDAIEVTGIARLGTVEITSALANEPCLAFGLHGATPDADIADAEGGDFDLELDGGERMMVSLEHAVLVVPASNPTPRAVDDGLAGVLEDRAIRTKPDVPVAIEELLLRDGDRITVTGTVLGGATVSLANGLRARVLAGTEIHPLVIRVG